MSFDRGRYERQCDGVFAWLGKGLEDHPPSSAPSPAIEAIVYSRVGTIVTRTNAPTRARLQHLNDAADNPPVVVARPGPVNPVGRCGSTRAHCLSFSQNNPSRILSPPNQPASRESQGIK